MSTQALAIGSERSGLFRPFDKAELRALGNWLIVWLVLANVGFAAMWFIGAPPRWPEIAAVGALGIVARERSYIVQVATFAGAMVFSILGFLAGLFNLSISSLLYSIRFFLELDPAQSMEYLVAGAVILSLIGVATFVLRRPQNYTDTRLVGIAFVAVLGFAIADMWMGVGMRGHYKRIAVEGAPFTSASTQAGFAATAATDRRHLLIVMVESLGTPENNPEMSRLLFARYDTPQLRRRFDFSEGVTTYYNSTTAGEVRELCGRWGDYPELLDAADESCLPARLRASGYQTTAMHSFSAGFFDRAEWYPNIGFDRSIFRDELVGNGARWCGGVFPGACDEDVPQQIAAMLKNADKPQFVYWLTVNSHLPVPPGMNLDVERCETLSTVLAEQYPMICRQFALWDVMDEALVREIGAADFPPTDVLIVGDHMPPYFDRHHRRQFAPDTVPWLFLKWRGDEGSDRDLAGSPAADNLSG